MAHVAPRHQVSPSRNTWPCCHTVPMRDSLTLWESVLAHGRAPEMLFLPASPNTRLLPGTIVGAVLIRKLPVVPPRQQSSLWFPVNNIEVCQVYGIFIVVRSKYTGTHTCACAHTHTCTHAAIWNCMRNMTGSEVACAPSWSVSSIFQASLQCLFITHMLLIL